MIHFKSIRYISIRRKLKRKLILQRWKYSLPPELHLRTEIYETSSIELSSLLRILQRVSNDGGIRCDVVLRKSAQVFIKAIDTTRWRRSTVAFAKVTERHCSDSDTEKVRQIEKFYRPKWNVCEYKKRHEKK